MKEDVKKLMTLLGSWQEENLELFRQLLKGNEELRQAATAYLKPLLDSLEIDILQIRRLPQLIAKKQLKNFPKRKTLVSIFNNIPIKNLNYSNRTLRKFPWWICELHQLQSLIINNNLITVIPKEIRQLKHLHNFSMQRNALTAIPEEIAELEALKMLNFDRNKITAIPAAIGQLTNLTKLQLDHNSIEEVPEAVGQLRRLNWLCLEANKITTLPKTLEGLKSLSWLSIERTPLGEKHDIKHGFYTSHQSSKFLNLLS